jgi:hypothetical protein
MELGVGTHVVWSAQAKYTIEGMQEDWRLFQYCLRHHPNHPIAKYAKGLTRRAFCRQNKATGRWEFVLMVRESTSTLLEEAKILVKPIDSD